MLIRNLAAVAAMTGSICLSLPAFADDMMAKPEIMMIMKDGKTGVMPIMDKAKMEDMMKNAEEMKDDMAFFVWGNKFYVVKNTKMADGRMSFDAWGAHFVK
jgi:hypothetical protein